jgi:hypothetical protein
MSARAGIVLGLLLGLPILSTLVPAAPAAAQATGPLTSELPARGDGAIPLVATRLGGQPIAVASCTSHTVPADGGGFEERLPCTHPLPPAGQARLVWLEGDGLISPARFLVPPGRGAKELPLPVVNAGLARWTAAAQTEAGFTGDAFQLYLLHLDAHLKADDDAWEMARWATAAEARQGVALPTGKFVALLFDDASGKVVGLSPPLEIAARQTTNISLRRPSPQAGHLFVELLRPAPVARKAFKETRVEWIGDRGEPRLADVVLTTARAVIALFYDLPPGKATLVAAAGEARLAGHSIRLPAGTLLYEQARLAALPNLRVVLELPPELRTQPLAIEMVDAQQTVVRRVELAMTAREADIAALPPDQLECRLAIPPYLFREPVDLRRGDAVVTFAPRLLAVHGAVYRGEEPTPAALVFTPKGRDEAGGITAETDAQGAYQTTFWQPGLYQVALHFESGSAPYTLEVEIPDLADSTLDLRAPGDNLQLRVIDGETGDPILRSTINLKHRGTDGSYHEEDISADGEIIGLPPLGPGLLEISAWAEGYLRSTPIGIQVEAPRQDEPIEIALSRTAATRVVWLRDSAGNPAAGVAVRAQFDLGDSPPIWEGQSDSEGVLNLPQETIGGFLLLRPDQRLAASVRVLDKSSLVQTDDPLVMVLMPGAPLRLQTVAGADQPRAARIALWIDGQRVQGETLSYLCGAAESDAEGAFECQSALPIESLPLVAWSTDTKNVEGASTSAPPLRPNAVVVQIIE